MLKLATQIDKTNKKVIKTYLHKKSNMRTMIFTNVIGEMAMASPFAIGITEDVVDNNITLVMRFVNIFSD
jgi:hypothetical protein